MFLVNLENFRHSTLRPKGLSSEMKSSLLRVTERETETREGGATHRVRARPGCGTRIVEHRTVFQLSTPRP